jgi:hypothetical protein
VYQLYAFLDGKRFRKNFQTRAKAEAERSVQEGLSLYCKSDELEDQLNACIGEMSTLIDGDKNQALLRQR